VEDAQKIRKSVLKCFERASLPNLSEEERKKNLHFVVIGGGSTGVEFAAELHDFVNGDLAKYLMLSVRVYLIDYIFCIINYHICRDIFGRLYILYNRLSYISGYIW
jgi:NADH dehydrogenase FAD-containing subunit